jgi:hypothetical protein
MPFESANSMVADLRQVLLCSPEAAGWGVESVAGQWKQLGFLRPPNAAAAEKAHAQRSF